MLFTEPFVIIKNRKQTIIFTRCNISLPQAKDVFLLTVSRDRYLPLSRKVQIATVQFIFIAVLDRVITRREEKSNSQNKIFECWLGIKLCIRLKDSQQVVI